MWLVKVGNINFQTLSEDELGNSQPSDEYERFSLKIDSIGLDVKIVTFHNYSTSNKINACMSLRKLSLN